MSERRVSDDAVEWIYIHYIKNNPEREERIALVRKRAALACDIYNVRNRLNMTREQLAEFSGLTPQDVEDLEESDYVGSWEDAVGQINRAFERWIKEADGDGFRLTANECSITVMTT
ncbi:MAG: hypothetical protein V2B18_13235 [Pseudomonadota bacterium]